MSNQTTQIKRLYQGNLEFVPITLSEAVVVNASNSPELGNTITTLDKVLRYMLAAEGQNAQGLDTLEQSLQQAVTNINQSLAKKQDTLTAGTGISIEKKGEELVISSNFSFGIYEIETELPPLEEAKLNVIYLVPNSSTSNSSENDILDEYIKIPNPNSGDPYIWERLGHITAGTDISGLVTRVETLELEVTNVKSAVSSLGLNSVTTLDVTTSGGDKVIVTYTIPANLYDSVVAEDEDKIISL